RLPHPLLGDDVDRQRVSRRVGHPQVQLGRPDENRQRQDQRNRDPGDLEARRTGDLLRPLVVGPAAILDREDDDENRDEKREEQAEQEQDEHQRVYLLGDGGGAFRY